MLRTYQYVGPKAFADRAPAAPAGVRIQRPEDVLHWVLRTGQELTGEGDVTATFIVDEAGWLRIADRSSEHVACAGGMPVLSAGEITLNVMPAGVRVSSVTNQSTGYCPEPESWPAVQAALERASLAASTSFTREFAFRRCPQCASINVIKDGVLECALCSTPLPPEWNVSSIANCAHRQRPLGELPAVP
jgi:hypothetical protein